MNNINNEKTSVTHQAYSPIGKSIYELLCEKCTTHLDRPALQYYEKTIKYSQLFTKIDEVAAALRHLGVSRGDVVGVSLPAVPEAVYLFYAINKIGAIFCGIDCRTKEAEIQQILNQSHPKVCFVADFHLREFQNIDNTTIVCISFEKSIGPVAAFASFFADLVLGRTKLIAQKNNIFTYGQFIRNASRVENVPDEQVNADDICAYFYTSGTTQGRKCVVLTNENINSSVMQYSYTQSDFANAHRFCSIMPLFTCYGISLGTHLPLILGMQMRLVPLFFGKNMKKLLVREKPAYIITVPGHWDHFVRDNFKNTDLSFLRGAIIGGDKLDPNSEDRLNSIFSKCNSIAKVMRGYGLTEASTAVTAQPVNTPKGSVGTTLCWSEIGIFDPDTGDRLPPMAEGEICICGPNVCQGYLNDPEATNKLLRRHSDGKIWLHSGDVGYLDENGFLFFRERIKRIYVRFDGTKISPYAIETQLRECPVVGRSLVVAIDDSKHPHGKCAKAYIELKQGIKNEEGLEAVKKYASSYISRHMRPEEYVIVDRLPVTKNGKLNYFE